MTKIMFDELLDEVDAAVFTGDSLEDPLNRDTLRAYIARWKRALEYNANRRLKDNG